jgi:uncharacterized protein
MIRLGLGLLGAAMIWSYQITCLDGISIAVTGLGIAALAGCLTWLPSRGWRSTVVVWVLIVLVAAGALTVRAARGSSAAADFAEARRGLAAMDTGDARAWPVDYRVRRDGKLGELVALYARQYTAVLFFFAILLLWRTLGLFLIGAGLQRLRVVTQAPARWRRVAVWGIGIGLPLSLLATALHAFEIGGVIDWRFPEFLHEASALPLAVGIGGAVLGVDPSRTSGTLWPPIEAAGRMALTNYVGQSFVMNVLAEPWGFGLYGRFGGPLLTILALVVFAVLATLSRKWLARFRLGPLEWIWRCGTYGRWLPNRTGAASSRQKTDGLSSV